MLINYLGDFKFECGSTVTILTTAAARANRINRLSGKGIFTGVILDKSKLKFQSELSRIFVTVDAKYVEEEYEGTPDDYVVTNKKADQWEEDTDNEPKPLKQAEICEPDKDDWYKAQEVKYKKPYKHKGPKHHKHVCIKPVKSKWSEHEDHDWTEYEEYKTPKKVICDYNMEAPPEKDKKGHSEADKKHFPSHEHHSESDKPNKCEEFIVLSLTCPSFPYYPGQIVWININEIVAVAVSNSD